MDAQHVICAGQVRHATRQTDATCHKSVYHCIALCFCCSPAKAADLAVTLTSVKVSGLSV